MAEMSFIVRADEELVRKLDYVAKYNDRSRNGEINRLLRRHVAEFERQVEKIPPAQGRDVSRP